MNLIKQCIHGIKLYICIALCASQLVYAENKAPFVINSIQIEGLERVNEGAVLLNIHIREGGMFEPEDANQIIRSLYAMGDFESIQVKETDGNLLIEIQERATITDVSFTDNKALKDEQLLELANGYGIKAGKTLDKAIIREVERALSDYYYSVGKYNANVSTIITKLERNRVNVEFVFTEGLSAKIKQINFLGNDYFDDDTLSGLFNSKYDLAWWQWLSSDKYQKQILAGDFERLKSLYFDAGFLKFQIESTNVSISKDKSGVYIALGLNEGNIYEVKSTKILGYYPEHKEQIENLNTFKPGDIYSGTVVSNIERDLKEIFTQTGYAYPTINMYPEFDDVNQTVNLSFHVVPGKRIYVRDIHFTGNSLTDDAVLRREMRQMEGTWLNSNSVELSLSRLNRLGFFETVDMKTLPIEGSDDQVDLLIEVKEARTGSINLGISYGSDTGLGLEFGVAQDNFLGTGNNVEINLSKNDYQDQINLNYTNPYWTLDGISLGGRVFYNRFDASKLSVSSYINNSYGLSANLGFPISEISTVGLGLGYKANDIQRLQDYLQINDFLSEQKGYDANENRLVMDEYLLNLSITRNNLNRGHLPTSGNHQQAAYKMTLPGSDVQYFKLQYDMRQYWPLSENEKFVFATKTRLAYGLGYGANKRIPFYENYYAGGASSLRGFKSSTAGPKAVYLDQGKYVVSNDGAGGNAQVLVGFDVIFPFPLVSDEARRQLRSSLFIDVASVWDTEFDESALSNDEKAQRFYYDFSDPTKYRASSGLALQWISPLGPLTFSVARPLKIYDGDDAEFFSFNLGHTF